MREILHGASSKDRAGIGTHSLAAKPNTPHLLSRVAREPPKIVVNRPFPSLRQMPLNTKSIVVGNLTMTNHRVENDRRDFLLAVAGGIAGLAAGSSPGRVLAQPASGPPLGISTIGAGREGGALGALFVRRGTP
jgi:hypothetical protein